jgi:hypothetical protein
MLIKLTLFQGLIYYLTALVEDAERMKMVLACLSMTLCISSVSFSSSSQPGFSPTFNGIMDVIVVMQFRGCESKVKVKFQLAYSRWWNNFKFGHAS